MFRKFRKLVFQDFSKNLGLKKKILTKIAPAAQKKCAGNCNFYIKNLKKLFMEIIIFHLGIFSLPSHPLRIKIADKFEQK